MKIIEEQARLLLDGEDSSLLVFPSHNFNLATKDILSFHDDVIIKVHELVNKHSFQVITVMLKRLTPLCTRTANATRWSSIYFILKRYVKRRVFILRIDLPKLSQLLLTKVEDENVDPLSEKLNDLDSITETLQDESVTLAEARAPFDEMVSRFHSNTNRL